MKVFDLAEALLRDYTVNGHKSIRGVQQRWDHLGPYFGALEASNLPNDVIELYIEQRQKEKAANSTINRELALLKRAYSLAINARKLSCSCRPYVPHLRENNVRKGFLPDDLYRAMARETARIGKWLEAIFEVCYSYGTRKSELLNLRVRQVNLGERCITLDPGTTKNEEARLLPMTAKVLELMAECIAGKGPEEFAFTREHRRGALDRGLTEPGVCSVKECGKPLRSDNRSGYCYTHHMLGVRGFKPRNGGRITDMRGAWWEATKAAGCPDLLLHDLRRTAVRNMVRSGVPEKVAMLLSGHRTRSVFDRYQILDRSDLDAAVRKLDEARARNLDNAVRKLAEACGTNVEPRKVMPRKVMPAAEVAKWLKQQAAQAELPFQEAEVPKKPAAGVSASAKLAVKSK